MQSDSKKNKNQLYIVSALRVGWGSSHLVRVRFLSAPTVKSMRHIMFGLQGWLAVLKSI
jgi:hypothetical protein